MACRVGGGPDGAPARARGEAGAGRRGPGVRQEVAASSSAGAGSTA